MLNRMHITVVFLFYVLSFSYHLMANPPELWSHISTATSPSIRSNAAMAYYPNSGQMVLFGGLHQNSYLNNIWTLTSNTPNQYTWTDITSLVVGTPPPVRAHASMVFDPRSGQIVLFGGSVNTNYFDDTWTLTYDSITETYNWTDITPSVGTPPSYTANASMIFDPSSGQIVLFGGSNQGLSQETWVLKYDSTNKTYTWTNITNSVGLSPPARYNASMAFNSSSGQAILFGGLGSGYLNDTWTLTYHSMTETYNWTDITSSVGTPPSERINASMAFDPTSGQIILFGGNQYPSGDFKDTWELTYDSTNTNYTWTDITTAVGTSPSARAAATMAFDPSNGQLILFGGNGNGDLNDTWTFGIPTNAALFWENISTTSSPPEVSSASMAFDPSSGQIILFGGFNSGNDSNDTWALTYNSTSATYTWTQLILSGTLPSARHNASMAFDSSRGQIILFGGNSGNTILNDTWALTYNSTSATYTWTQLAISGTSPKLQSASMIFDPSSGQIILFGGFNGNTIFNDIWALTYNSTNATYTWTQLTISSPSPSARYSASMVFDPSSGQIVLFGGLNNGNDSNDTWALTYNSTSATYTWTQLAISGPPPPRYSASMAFDPSSGQIILFGGLNNGNDSNDTWVLTYNSTSATYTWTQLIVSGTSPSWRYSASMAFDPSSGQIILFGGINIGNFFNDTWALSFGIATQIISANTTTFVVGQLSSFKIVTAGYPAPSISEIGTLPSNITFTDNHDGTGTLVTLAPSETTGTYLLNFMATNSVSSVTQIFTLIVGEAPTVTSENTTTFVVGQSSSFTVMTMGFPLPSIKESGYLPAGISFVDNGNGTASFFGTPTNETESIYSFILTVSNGIASNVVQNFTLMIAKPTVILPPKNIKGFRKVNQFATQTDDSNVVKWEAPSHGTAIMSYRIYRDQHLKKLIANIPHHGRLQFEEHNCKKGKSYSYYILSVDQFGNESIPVKVVIKPKKN